MTRTCRMICKVQNGPSRSVDAVDLSPCKLKKRLSFRFATWFSRDFKSYSRSKEETDVWRFGSLLFCLDRLRGSLHDRKRIQVWCLLCGQKWKQTREKSLLVWPETTANSRSAIRILYLSRTWAGTDTRSKWRPSIVQVAHSKTILSIFFNIFDYFQTSPPNQHHPLGKREEETASWSCWKVVFLCLLFMTIRQDPVTISYENPNFLS